MWKKIGIKGDNNTSKGDTNPSVGNSPKNNTFRRVRPLDERSLGEKDNSYSKNSASSSKLSSGKQEDAQRMHMQDDIDQSFSRESPNLHLIFTPKSATHKYISTSHISQLSH